MLQAITEHPILFSGPMVRAILGGRKTQTRRVVKPHWKCPYGQVGDHLWVKETHQFAAAMNVCHRADDYTIYRATDPDWQDTDGWHWRPSIHMPRWASRIALEVTGVHTERVQDIDWVAAIAEGCKDPRYSRTRTDHDDPKSPVHQFLELWDSINARRGFGWAENPRVWVVEFRQVTHG